MTTQDLSATKLALLKIRDLKRQLANVAERPNEGIAIVSMACRFPRSSSSPEAFWEQLSQGADEVGDVPRDRWDIEAYFDKDSETPGRMYARRGAFLDSIDQMDADFFGIAPREATWIDPQQRLLLEVSWEALERACWPSDLVGRRTGVFVGWMHNDYQNECSDSLLNLNPYIATGSAGSFLCGRLSYQLGLQGPSLAVDTACSSSLVALHLACQSLYRGECDRALAGGVNVMASPKTTVLTCKLKALSPSGFSRAFDARADGYVRGEGCGVVALRRLSDARRDGDPILAVIRGSAVTHNGHVGGLTVPSAEAQERVIRECLETAGVNAKQVAYLEAHGTGTELGDPIEMRAAAAVLGKGRDPQDPLLVGSVKTNVGHLEAAAGMAGLLKVVLALQHGRIPPHLHFEQPNPHIAWDQLPVKIVDRMTPWPHAGARVAGVSAFGMSGVNAHVVLEGYVESSAATPSSGRPTDSPKKGKHLLVLSGRATEAVQQLGQRFRDWLGRRPDVNLADVCRTAGVGRKHFERRAALVVDSVQHAQVLLNELEQGGSAPGLFVGAARTKPMVAWQFTGQGSQRVGMGQSLYESQPVFRETLDRCEQYLRDHRQHSLLDVMFHDAQALNQTVWTQPAIFALEMGLAAVLRSWGLQPDVVLGHSVGQFAAACVAGMIDLEDGLRLITERSRLTGELPDGGAMAAVFAPVDDVRQAIAADPQLSIAAINGSHAVISGPHESVEAALREFSAQRVRNQRLATSHAFHSGLMEPAMDAWRRIVETVQFRRAQLPCVCNVSGKLLDAEQILDSDYWGRHLRQAVQFAGSVATLADLGCDVVLELGPQPVLTGMAAACWPGPRPAFLHSLSSDRQDEESLLSVVGQLYVNGAQPDFAAIGSQREWKHLNLPTYPFQRKRYWGAETPTASRAERGLTHPLLGEKLKLAAAQDEVRFENHMRPDKPNWLSDHQVFGDIVFPGAAYVEMGLAATAGKRALQDVVFETPLRLSQAVNVQTIVHGAANQPRTIELYSSLDEAANWTRNFSANVSTAESTLPESVDREEILARCQKKIDVAEFYESVRGLGLQYGPQFQTIREIHRGESEVLVRLETDGDVLGYLIPPMLMDGAFQSLAVELLQDVNASFYLPVGMDRVERFATVAGEVWNHARWLENEGNVRTADLTLFDRQGTVLARIEKLRLRGVRRAALRQLSGGGPERLIYTLGWQPATLQTGASESGDWLVVRGPTIQHDAVVEAMTLRGQRCIDVQLDDEQDEPEFAADQCRISGKHPEHWTSLLSHYFPAESDSRLDGIVWIAGSTDLTSRAADLLSHTQVVCEGLLGMLQALRQNRLDQFARGLRLVTQQGVAAEPSESVHPENAQFWGLGRVISSEYPGLRCRLIDVNDLEASVSTLIDAVLDTQFENQIALRVGQARVARLMPRKAPRRHASFRSAPMDAT